MAILGFRPEFRDKVEDGRKCRTYRMAKCIYERKTGRCTDIGVGSLCRHDYLNCPGYEYRIKKGDTIHAYTGLMQRLYCKEKSSSFFNKLVPYKTDILYFKCSFGESKGVTNCLADCTHTGAKLLRPDLPRCTDAYPIKLKYITEEDARLDGFESLAQLKDFLIKNFNAKPDTPIQAIIWEELKGPKAGK